MIDGDTKLLVICPTRSRSDRIRVMIKSFEETRSAGTELLIYIADDDPQLEKYTNLGDHTVFVGPRKSIVEVYNYFSTEVYPLVPYYAEVNDDHVYHTFHWDEKLISAIESVGGYGLANPNDLLTDLSRFLHPSASVIDGEIVRLLGYWIPRRLKHLGTDTYLGLLFSTINRLVLCQDVIVEHRHKLNNPDLADETYELTYGPDHDRNCNYAMLIIDVWRIFELPVAYFKIQRRIVQRVNLVRLFSDVIKLYIDSIKKVHQRAGFVYFLVRLLILKEIRIPRMIFRRLQTRYPEIGQIENSERR